MCQTPIITARTIPKGWLYWQSADVHCFAELKTSNQILCCTNVIATTAVLGVTDNANSLSYETSLNTSVFNISSRNSFEEICYPGTENRAGPSERLLMQSSNVCCEGKWTVQRQWKTTAANQRWLGTRMCGKGDSTAHPLFAIWFTVCKTPVVLLSSSSLQFYFYLLDVCNSDLTIKEEEDICQLKTYMSSALSCVVQV